MTDKWTSGTYREFLDKQNKKKPSKYKNKRGSPESMRDGITFDSIKEARYYDVIKIRLLAGEFKRFERQVNYALVVNDVLIATYRADFVITHWTGRKEVIDVKSDFTATLSPYQMKKKLMKAIYGIDIVEVI